MSKSKVGSEKVKNKMGIENIIVLCQVVAFLCSFIISFFIFIPVSVNIREYDGHCLLGAMSGVWTNSTGASPQLTTVTWGASSDCGFVVFVGVTVMILSIIYIVWESVYLYKNTDSSWLASFFTCMLCLAVCLMLFTSSLIISMGFKRWCDFLTKPPSPVTKCENSEYISFISDSDIYERNFFSEFSMAAFGSWMCWICWMFLSVLSVIKVWRYHKREAFLISMNRERQRLLQKVGHKEPVVM